MPQENTINLTLHYLGEEHRVQTNRTRHHSLMTLIVDELAIPGFGLCCGMGSCGTCLVQIAHQQSQVKRPVLACSMMINDDLANVDVFVPDRVY